MGGVREEARLVSSVCQDSFSKRMTVCLSSGACQGISVVQMLQCSYFWCAYGEGGKPAALSSLLNLLRFLAWLPFFLCPPVFLSRGAGGCRSVPRQPKQQGAKQEKNDLLSRAAYGPGALRLMGYDVTVG